MAGGAVIPLAAVRSRKDWKVLVVVIAKIAFPSGGMAVVAIGAIEHVAAYAAVLFIHFSLSMLMALHTGKYFAVIRLYVAGAAIIPLVVVFAAENREKLVVMVAKIGLLPGGVATVAIGAIKYITGDALVFRIHFGLSMLMALHTGKGTAVIGVDMARLAIAPGVFVLP